MFALLALVLSAPPQFEVKAPAPEERERRAAIRCGEAARPISESGDVGTFSCPRPGVDVTDSLRQSEVVVKGTIFSIETPAANQLGDPAPQWRRASVRVKSVLRGQKKSAVRFYFISATTKGYDEYRKVKIGQEGIWILSRGTGVVNDLTMLTALDDHPVSAEDYLKELIAVTACPQKLTGSCEHAGEVCPGAEVTCRCELPCGGGAPPRDDAPPQPRWICRPTVCASAKEGAMCAPDGVSCEGCWGTRPWTCEDGRWKFRRISPPP